MKGKMLVNSEEVAQLKVVSAIFNEISNHEQEATITSILDMLFDVLMSLVFSIGEIEAKNFGIRGYLKEKRKLAELLSK